MAGTVVILTTSVRGLGAISIETSREAAEQFIQDWSQAIGGKAAHRGVLTVAEADGGLVAVPSTEILNVTIADREETNQ